MKEIANGFNVFEVFLWGSIALALFIKSFGLRRELRKRARIASLAFLAFGVSDLIELKTGARWKPLWLFLLKAGCVFVLLWVWLAYLKERRRDRNSRNVHD